MNLRNTIVNLREKQVPLMSLQCLVSTVTKEGLDEHAVCVLRVVLPTPKLDLFDLRSLGFLCHRLEARHVILDLKLGTLSSPTLPAVAALR